MKIDVEEINPCRKKLNVEIPEEEVSKQYASVLEEYTRNARIKGFRPGKAPANVVKMKYAKDIRQDVKDRLIPQGYREALAQESLTPVAVLEVSDGDFTPGQPFSFSITCDVAPRFDLPEYSGIEVENRTEPVKDEEIDKAVEQVRDQFASFEDVEREIRKDDLVQVDYSGTIDGAPVTELAPEAKGLDTADDFWILVGESAFLPEFGDKLLGCRTGEDVTIDVHFADDFHAEELRGKDAVYEVKVKAVREKVLAELDEEKLKPFGVTTEEELRKRVADDLEQRNEQRMRQDFRNQIIEKLLANTVLDLPESVVQEETKSTIYDMVQNITRDGASSEQVEENKEQIFARANQTAAEKVKVRYLLGAIAEKEEVQTSESDLDQRIQSMAVRYQSTPEQVRAALVKNEQLESLRQDLRFEKTLDLLLEQAIVKGA